MSVVAWDGKTLAADRAVFSAGVVSPTRKLLSNDRFIAGYVGRQQKAHALALWAIGDADPGKYPNGADDCEAIVIDRITGEAVLYDSGPQGIPLQGVCTIGEAAAKAAALALMLNGMSAARAVEFLVQSRRYDAVGFGVDHESILDTD